jgi:hypothetical protein
MLAFVTNEKAPLLFGREAISKTDLYFYKPIANTCDYSMITIFFVALYSLASSL